jgi:hypothetical protein
MSSRSPASVALVLLVACGPAPAPQPATPTPAAAAPAPAPAAVDPMLDQDARPAPEPPLTQEELDLIAADPNTLTKELRVKRAYALRRKILQNPDSPMARQLEAMRRAAERGELPNVDPKQLGDKPKPGGLTLHARHVEEANAGGPVKSETPAGSP